MGRSPVSVVKRQREQAKRERQQMKAQKRAQRKSEKSTDGSGPEIEVAEGATEAS